ncbi:MAG TPA: hypothetical protein VNU84_01180 [Candidatus Acidoferrum sp.]|jgi:hypothetical protein|nr:hypothetical protein [Candidatus Acidoferrum sp.]
MPYEFSEHEPELQPDAGGSRSGVPPRKHTGAAVLDPPVPPRRPLSPIPSIPVSTLLKILAVLILVGIGVAAFLYMFKG